MAYFKYNVSLTDGQKDKLVKSYQKKAPMTLRLKHNQLSGNDAIMLTQRQVNKIQKSKQKGTGCDVKISATQVRKQEGGFLGSLLPTLMKMGTMALPYLSKAVGPLAQGALSGLANWGVKKALPQDGSGLFSVPQDKVDKLIKYKDYLTPTQKKQIIQALQTGSGMNLKLTKKQQQGGFLGTILTSIGIPMLMSALTGKGLQVEPKSNGYAKTYHLPPQNTKGGLIYPYDRPPPIIGSWDDTRLTRGYGVNKCQCKKTVQKKKEAKRKGIDSRKKQPVQRYPPTRSNSVKFINKPLSNVDILNWVKHLGINHFRGVFSRDNLPRQIHKRECGVVNLDDLDGPGTHWVCYRNIGKNCEYFDSFGLDIPTQIQSFLSTSGKTIIYPSDELQERSSVLCGYWCLYYLLERQKGVSLFDTIHNESFSLNNQHINHRFLISYFNLL